MTRRMTTVLTIHVTALPMIFFTKRVEFGVYARALEFVKSYPLVALDSYPVVD